MIDLPVTLQEHDRPAEVALISPAKMRFDPTKKSLSDRIGNLRLDLGRGNSNFHETLLVSGTNTIVGVPQNIAQGKTIQTAYTNIEAHDWWRLPTIGSYEDLENLNDLQDVELAAYQASKKFSW